MTLKNYEYFLKIAEQKNISKAAQQLYISQPTLSLYLSKLEEELGVRLFDRTKSPLELTCAGKLYYDYVYKYKQFITSMDNDFKALQTGDYGKLSIGISMWKSTYFTPKIMPEFIRRYPYIEVQLCETGVNDLYNRLHNGSLDFCIMNTPFYNKNVTYEIIYNERILLVGNKDHPLVRRYPSDLENPAHFDVRLLQNEKLLFNEPHQVQNKVVSNMLDKYHIKPKYPLVATNILTLLGLVASGVGFTFMPELGRYYRNDADKLVFYTVDDPVLSWSLSIVYRKDASLSNAARTFIDITKRHFQQNPL